MTINIKTATLNDTFHPPSFFYKPKNRALSKNNAGIFLTKKTKKGRF